MNTKKLIFALIMVVLLAMPLVSAQSNTTDYLTVTNVRINGDDAEDGDILRVKLGEELDIRVTVRAGDNDVENAEIEAFIAGYRYSKYERDLVNDFEGPFDLPANNKDSFDLDLEVPFDMEQKDAKLRIIISDENSPGLIIFNYQLNIEGADESNAIRIRNFLISPSERIEAGRALAFKVKVENIGEDTLDDVTVRVAIPALDIQAFETIDEIDSEETQSFESLLLRIPSDATPGDYEVVATVEFDRFESVEETKIITVKEAVRETAGEGKTTVTMPESVEVVKGSTGAVYPILIQNQDSASRTYVISVSGVSSWATSSFEPSSVVIINGGSSKTIYLKLSANDEAEDGDRVFQVSIASGDDTSETSVVANVKGGEADSTTTDLRTVLEWVLIILIIVLIILGLVLVFSRMRKGDKEDDDESQTYY